MFKSVDFFGARFEAFGVWCLFWLRLWLVCWSIYFLFVHISGLRWVFYRMNYDWSLPRTGSLLCLSFLGKAWIPGTSELKVLDHCNALFPCERLDVWFELRLYSLAALNLAIVWSSGKTIPWKIWLLWLSPCTVISFWSMTWTLFDLWWWSYFLANDWSLHVRWLDSVFPRPLFEFRSKTLHQYSREHSSHFAMLYFAISRWNVLLMSGLNF